ncbi:MAG: hypothetical protein KatS3mg102_2179 [Planctomycetota bacterium]|nr:MAG: hypothetical protein KatS3mg102_2179 [Planctomycetota bacterium]
MPLLGGGELIEAGGELLEPFFGALLGGGELIEAGGELLEPFFGALLGGGRAEPGRPPPAPAGR